MIVSLITIPAAVYIPGTISQSAIQVSAMFERVINTSDGADFDSPEEARRYAEHMEKYSMMYNAFLKHLSRLQPGNRLLEIGAGTGLLTSRVAELFPEARITALDLSPHMIERGRQHADSRAVGGRITWVIGNAQHRDFMATLGKFDLVYSSLVLHEFRNAGESIKILYDAVARWSCLISEGVGGFIGFHRRRDSLSR